MRLTRDNTLQRADSPTIEPPQPPRADGTADDGGKPVVKTGTTCVGITTEDGVVIATDRRASTGGQFVVNKDVRKVEQIHSTAAMTLVGSVAQAQWFIRAIRGETSLYEVRFGRPMEIETLFALAGTMVRKYELSDISPLIGGVGDDGGRLVSLDPAGGVLSENYAASGSGMQLAYGHLEKKFDPSHSNEEAIEVAASAVDSASNRDTASGDGISVAEITAEGIDIHAHRTLDELL